MRKLNKPTDDPGDVYLECIKIVREAELRTRLTAIKDLIVDAAEEFDNKVTKGELHTILREKIVNGNVTAKELEDVYTIRMSKRDTPGRKIYDKIKIAPYLGVCPLCSHSVVTTLDHYLPKTEYPRLSVVPINLVPCCSDCNKSKLKKFPTRPEEEALHPYYDDIEADVWLKAIVNHMTPPSIRFQVDAPSKWDLLLAKRVEYHFKSLSLNDLYSVQAAVLLTQINFRLNLLYKKGGAEMVRNYLIEGEETISRPNINSWQAAMYRAMANDDWFCEGGFKFDD